MDELIEKIVKGEHIDLDLTNPNHLKLIKKVNSLFTPLKTVYDKMYEYYKGNTDAMANYKFVTTRSNNKVNLNYIKKFVKEEVSYSVGKEIAYESISGNDEFIKDINYELAHWKSNHNSDLMKYLLIFTEVYELYYLNKNLEFTSKLIKPTDGYAFVDSFGNILFFIHYYKNKLNNKKYMDVYTDKYIYHLDSKFNIIETPSENHFKEVPISYGQLSEETTDDSLYKDIKGLQDASEINLSDISNEISDTRNAYLVFKNVTLDEDQATKMKEKGILILPGDRAAAEWLVKNINDTFIQNTVGTLEDKMYQIGCHINANEKMQSNTSSLALRARLNAMENKCSLNQNAHKDIVKNRIRFLCKYLKFRKNKDYDYKDIKLKYTPNIPQDDLMMAQILSQVPEGTISLETARTQFSFIDNAQVEGERVNKEMEAQLAKYPKDLSNMHDGEIDG